VQLAWPKNNAAEEIFKITVRTLFFPSLYSCKAALSVFHESESDNLFQM